MHLMKILTHRCQLFAIKTRLKRSFNADSISEGHELKSKELFNLYVYLLQHSKYEHLYLFTFALDILLLIADS